MPAALLHHGLPLAQLSNLCQSQGANGEFDASAARPLAAHTDLVGEALVGHRLILANHALLPAHLDELAGLCHDTFTDDVHTVVAEELAEQAAQAISAIVPRRGRMTGARPFVPPMCHLEAQ